MTDIYRMCVDLNKAIWLSLKTADSCLKKGFSFADVYVDFEGAEVFKKGEEVDLLAQEYRLLRYLIVNRGKTVSREDLLSDVWDYNSAPTTPTVDVHIAWLRQKLEPNPKHPQHIITVHKLGYKFTG